MSKDCSIELTPYEKFFVNASRCGDLLVMGSAFVEFISSFDKFNKELVREALIFMQRRHPFFRAYFEINNNENRVFLKFDNQNIEEKIVLEWLDLSDQELVSQRNEAINKSSKFNSTLFNYEDKGLLWKTQIIAYQEEKKVKYMINLVFHMAISEGVNITTLTIELVNIINALLTNKICDEMIKTLDVIDNLHVLCEQRKLFKDEHKETIKRLNSQEKVKFNLPREFKSENETGSISDMFKLNKNVSKNIILKSKLNEVRLTSYFQTLAFYSLNNLYKEYGLEFPKRVTIMLPATLRPRYEPNLEYYHCGNHMAMFISSTDENKYGNYEDFWKDTRYFHEMIYENTSLNTGSIFSTTHNEEFDQFNRVFSKSNSLEEAKDVLTNEVYCDLCVSNIGRFVNDAVSLFQGPIEIKEIYCTDSQASNPRLTLAIIIHLFYWRDEIMVQIGANKYSMGSRYFDRYKEIFLDTLNSTLN